METRETIIRAATEMITENGGNPDAVTVRDICKRANVGLGLVNYHFENKDKLIELCVARIINGIVDKFRSVREQTQNLGTFEKLECLGNMTFTFLFEHDGVSRISVLSDMRSPGEDDNTHRTYAEYLPLVSACRPDWSRDKVERKTFCLIAAMQQAFLRSDAIAQTLGVNLKNSDERKDFHTKMLHDILEM